MFKKLDFILQKYEELSLLVSDPEVIADQDKWRKHMKELGEMEPIVLAYKEYKKTEENLAGAKEMLGESDEEIREMAKMEITDCEEKLENLEQTIVL